MFIKQIKKKNKNSDKVYTYYRLVHTYKIGKKVRHQNIIGLGKLATISRENHKALADRIEVLITGSTLSLFPEIESNSEVESIAQRFADKIIKEKLFTTNNTGTKSISHPIKNNYQEVDLATIEQISSKEIGGEWLVKQAFDELKIANILEEIGMPQAHIDVAQMLLTAKLIHPSSELETERWITETSAVKDLYKTEVTASRYMLYQAATKMYSNKNLIDETIYSKVTNIFSSRSKIVIYDLTNMYFEGQMLGSEKAAFGRSKQKKLGIN